jgi:hypothetical protein
MDMKRKKLVAIIGIILSDTYNISNECLADGYK